MRLCFYGGPGVGKSTAAAKWFVKLKEKGYPVELVTEYVKSWAWEGRTPSSYDQFYIFAKQLRREDILTRRGVHIITDSPLPLQLVYARRARCSFYNELLNMCRYFEKDHPAVHILLKRTVPYQAFGRYETLEQAQVIDKEICAVLDEYGVPYHTVDPQNAHSICEEIEKKLS